MRACAGPGKPRFTTATLGFFARTYIQRHRSALNALEVIVDQLVRGSASPDSGDVDVDTTFSCVTTPSAVPILFAACMEELCKCFGSLGFRKAAVQRTSDAAVALLMRASKAVNLFSTLTQMTKQLQKRPVILSVVKQGRSFVDTFLSAIPFLGNQLRLQVRPLPCPLSYVHPARCVCGSHVALASVVPFQTEEVMHVLKHFQVATRQMQSICAHSKVVRDASMMAAVPRLRRLLEAVIYRVKVLLAAPAPAVVRTILMRTELLLLQKVLADESMLRAFRVGNLRNKALDGTVRVATGALRRVSPRTSEADCAWLRRPDFIGALL